MRLGDLKNSRMITIVVVYLSLFLDNVLLTVVGNYNYPERKTKRTKSRAEQFADSDMFQCQLSLIICARSTRIRPRASKRTKTVEWDYY